MSRKHRSLNNTGRPGPPSAPVNLASWLTVVVLCAMVLWSARALSDYGELFIKLSGKSVVERGPVGSDEWANFLTRVGRPPMQRIFADAQRCCIADLQRSGAASGWAGIVQTENTLQPLARPACGPTTL